MRHILKGCIWIGSCALALLVPAMLFSQAQLVMGGANIIINGGGKLVIANANPNAFAQTAPGGGIAGAGPEDNVVWMIGSRADNYSIPFSNGTTSIPLSFTTSGASGKGIFILGTYATPTWKNSDDLPPGIGSLGQNGEDNSVYTIDRFWQINASGYTIKPGLSNLVFSYAETDWNKSGNLINEPSMAAQRYNDMSGTWGDFAPAGRDDPNANTVTVPIVQPADVYPWWTLVDAAFALPVQLINFTATVQDKSVLLQWQTATEINTQTFTIEKTSDLIHIASAGALPAAGNSTGVLSYTFTDKAPFAGVSYYRLRTTDKDGKFSYSVWRLVNIAAAAGWQVYPNPAINIIYIRKPAQTAGKVQMQLIASDGRVLRDQVLTNITTPIPVSDLPAGIYIIRINENGNCSSHTLIKQ